MRAKFKSYKDLPESLKCCEASILKCMELEGVEIEITGDPMRSASRCMGCGELVDFTKYAVIGQEFDFVKVDAIDIDEGAA